MVKLSELVELLFMAKLKADTQKQRMNHIQSSTLAEIRDAKRLIDEFIDDLDSRISQAGDSGQRGN